MLLPVVSWSERDGVTGSVGILRRVEKWNLKASLDVKRQQRMIVYSPFIKIRQWTAPKGGA